MISEFSVVELQSGAQTMVLTNTAAILFPMVGLAGLTALVQLLIPIARVRSASRGEVGLADFAFGESRNVPPDVSIPNRNYMNLLEFPTLLYAVCLLAYVAVEVTSVMVTLAWAFVGLRTIHSTIHLTYNRVSHRALAFGASNIVMVVLWVQVFGQIFARNGA